MVGCSSGPAIRQLAPGCADADLDLDGHGDVDSDDFAIFQRCWSGSAAADKNCQ
jgi:hypothetical protein